MCPLCPVCDYNERFFYTKSEISSEMFLLPHVHFTSFSVPRGAVPVDEREHEPEGAVVVPCADLHPRRDGRVADAAPQELLRGQEARLIHSHRLLFSISAPTAVLSHLWVFPTSEICVRPTGYPSLKSTFLYNLRSIFSMVSIGRDLLMDLDQNRRVSSLQVRSGCSFC